MLFGPSYRKKRAETYFAGHGWDVKCVKWHPTKGLLVSGSKDNLIKFWDPRTSRVLTTLCDHLLLGLPRKLTTSPLATATRTRCRHAPGVRREISLLPLHEISSSKCLTFEQ